jgi:uncharacterized repeat protein (TIGR03803 family)
MKGSKSLLTLGFALACAALTFSLAVRAQAQTFTRLYSFCAKTNCADGASPSAPLVQGTDGNLYGETGFGGAASLGTVFKITTAGDLTTLYSFCSSSPCTDGAIPQGGLTLATDGNFYGVSGGGANNYGTVFKITAAGKLTTLHAFDLTDGGEPQSLIQAANGNFYGTTLYGGAYGQGALFEITASGTFTTLHSFCANSGCPDGTDPNGLTQGADGNLYGTTFYGGESDNCRGHQRNLLPTDPLRNADHAGRILRANRVPSQLDAGSGRERKFLRYDQFRRRRQPCSRRHGL